MENSNFKNMAILLSLSIIPLILNVILIRNNNKRNKNIYLCLCAILLILVMGLRGRYVGSLDTNNYCRFFESAVRQSNLKTYLSSRGVSHSNLLFSEISFYTFLWGLAQMFDNYQFLLLFSTIIMIVCTVIYIKNNSEDEMLSIIMFITLGLYTFCMNGMRQGIAMSICLFAYDFAKKKKLIPFLLTVLLAMSFHKSAVFFIIVYFLFLLKPNKISIIVFTCLTLFIIVNSVHLVSIFDSLLEENYAESHNVEVGGLVTVLIYLLVIFSSLIVIKNWKENNYLFSLVLVSIMGLVIYTFRYFSFHIFERMSYYFFYALLILLPATINKFEYKLRILIKIFICLICILLFAYRLNGSLFENFYFLNQI